MYYHRESTQSIPEADLPPRGVGPPTGPSDLHGLELYRNFFLTCVLQIQPGDTDSDSTFVGEQAFQA
jgi:hypothetical protein